MVDAPAYFLLTGRLLRFPLITRWQPQGTDREGAVTSSF